MSANDILSRIWPASGNHHKLPEEIPAAASARTETFTSIAVVTDETQAWPAPVKDAEFTLPRRTLCQIFRRAYTPPPPFTSQPRFDRSALHAMRQDCRSPEDGGLPVFTSLIGGPYDLHQMAWRAPRNVYEGEI